MQVAIQAQDVLRQSDVPTSLTTIAHCMKLVMDTISISRAPDFDQAFFFRKKKGEFLSPEAFPPLREVYKRLRKYTSNVRSFLWIFSQPYDV